MFEYFDVKYDFDKLYIEIFCGKSENILFNNEKERERFGIKIYMKWYIPAMRKFSCKINVPITWVEWF